MLSTIVFLGCLMGITTAMPFERAVGNFNITGFDASGVPGKSQAQYNFTVLYSPSHAPGKCQATVSSPNQTLVDTGTKYCEANTPELLFVWMNQADGSAQLTIRWESEDGQVVTAIHKIAATDLGSYYAAGVDHGLFQNYTGPAEFSISTTS